MVGRLRAVFAAVEKLSASEQEHLAALFEENIADDIRWHELFQRPGSQDFFAQLREEAAQAEKDGTLIECTDEDWV